ncbi:MAG: 30S ribosome-binding factor RbfA [Acidobacteriota bacterium]
MSHRSERVAEQLRAELSQILRFEMKDPRVALASVSRLELTRDLSHAQVYISVLGDDEQARNDALEAIERAKGFIRSQVGKRVRLRVVPELVFHLDRGAEHSQHISDLLDQLHDRDDATS